jgi:glycine dehydrogenase subunit 2
MVFRQAIWDEPLLSELSKHGRKGYSLPKPERRISEKVGSATGLIPESMLRLEPPALPELSEPEIVRHFVRLSQMNFAIDLGMYPLGSCTMKYNPKISQRIANNPKIANLHPYQDESTVQGTLEIMHELETMLCEIAGMDRFSLAPAAGAQGEYVGALMTRKYLDSVGLQYKNEMIVPDSAHGTNPSSAAMAGFKVIKIPTSEEGIVTEESTKKVITRNTAGMMLTVPNTLGIFEREILGVTRLIHDSGGLMYYDGANMNALLGQVRPGDMGFDIVHINVHKTFGTPHGGGGPGAGPVGVKNKLSQFLPVPLISFSEGKYQLDYSAPKSIGNIKSFFGNTAVLLRAYCYILSLGREGMKSVSEQAVLSANYLLRMLEGESYSLLFSPSQPRMHEFVVSSLSLKRTTGVSAGDIAKKILDSGMHSPTTYFPLIVPEALMIEPTETESVENVEKFGSTLNNIAKLSTQDSDAVKGSPKNTSVGRLDEYHASYPGTMILNWNSIGKEAPKA